jgi:ABC-type Fe3+/spermidine/putrescine transport system ATPase subunit
MYHECEVGLTMAAATPGMMLEVQDVVHRYGPVLALDHVSISAARGEFLTILGESGSGKTTMLRVISGLERPQSVGALLIGGENVADLPAAQRNCTTVFQSYALFPHMSVEENVAYGLKIRGVPMEERRRRVDEALSLVRLNQKSSRRIGQLSGGERQRVALARAIVTRPALLLLDEPLGALDERLRFDMQTELVELHRALGMTFIYITHSQEEALTMSDRILLMRHGRVEQAGRPEALFDRPVNRFVASFMGFENLLSCRVERKFGDGRVAVRVAGRVFHAATAVQEALTEGSEAVLAIRAERFAPAEADDAAANLLPCRPAEGFYRGKYVDQRANSEAGPLRLRAWDKSTDFAGLTAVRCSADDCVVVPQ